MRRNKATKAFITQLFLLSIVIIAVKYLYGIIGGNKYKATNSMSYYQCFISVYIYGKMYACMFCVPLLSFTCAPVYVRMYIYYEQGFFMKKK